MRAYLLLALVLAVLVWSFGSGFVPAQSGRAGKQGAGKAERAGNPWEGAGSPWEMEDSTSSASLRGVHAVGGGVAWASGSGGTILRTEDGGYEWQVCTVPPNGDNLDFRGIWAWDAQTAVVMSSGPGDQSRLYRTADGCASWKLVLSNPDKDGFWDAVQFESPDVGYILGDPVGGRFALLRITGAGEGLYAAQPLPGPAANAAEGGAFAASNSGLAIRRVPGQSLVKLWFGTGGVAGTRAYSGSVPASGGGPISTPAQGVSVPLASGTASSGVFSLAFRDSDIGVAVGGDYQKPNDPTGTAAYSTDGGLHWSAARQPAHGYRSAVAWDGSLGGWIAVGTNGSDISFDDGRTWTLLDRDNWNALSLPWVVGPKGRIGKLRGLPQTDTLKLHTR